VVKGALSGDHSLNIQSLVPTLRVGTNFAKLHFAEIQNLPITYSPLTLLTYTAHVVQS
jgi:hypothetical protein